jgi:hypothetical protein
MSVPSIALRRLPIFSALPRARLLTSHLTRHTFTTSAIRMAKNQDRGEETTGISEWKQRPPYRVHEKNEDFDVKYEANCHCGKVKYQLSRREPLDSKLCHCTTCQTQHGTCYFPSLLTSFLCFQRPRLMCVVYVQPHPSNGPPFSTKPTSTSRTVTTVWSGMIRKSLSSDLPYQFHHFSILYAQ